MAETVALGPAYRASLAPAASLGLIWAARAGDNRRVTRTCINTPLAPAAVGPYSQAVVHAGRVYSSGQIPLDPATGKLVAGDIAAQTHQVMRNLRAVLEAAGSGLDRVLKSTVFVTDLGDFALINQVYGSYFPEAPPARSTVQVSALPLGARVEIEVVASVG
ncbi:MAG TPA: RidA family protein [Polyangiaceae bacterium]|jgi:2-iminobutanoate/2-iminopropanoate deaminase|nr:RidA family protein [Polyangiaceae bacterium]